MHRAPTQKATGETANVFLQWLLIFSILNSTVPSLTTPQRKSRNAERSPYASGLPNLAKVLPSQSGAENKDVLSRQCGKYAASGGNPARLHKALEP